MTKKLGAWIMGHRLLVMVLVLAATAFFAWQIPRVRIESPTIDLFPSSHPYVETFKKYSDVFGGASRVVIQLEVKQGTIFNLPVLEKIRRITKELELIPGVNNYQVLSLAQRKVKELKVDAERGFRAVPVMWPEVPRTQVGIENLRRRVHANRRIHGTLVSLDDKATLIVAGFFEKDLDPLQVYRRIEQIVSREVDDNTELQVIGRPILLGTIMNQYGQLLWLFTATALSILLVLFLYFRDFWRVTVPVLTALLSAVWGLGFLGLLGLNFDPLVIVVPFIISARALSHSVQLIERFTEELAASGDKVEAARATFNGLFKPGLLGIVTDAAGVLLVLTTPIPLLRKLALMGGFWVLSIIVSDLIFNPVLLSFLPVSALGRRRRRSASERLLGVVSTWCLGRRRWVVLGLAGILFAVGFVFASRLVIGDVHPGTPMLWPDSRYNRDTQRIASRFRNTEEFTVVVEGESRDAIKNPAVLRMMEAFQRHLESIPEVGSTSSLVDLLPGIISILHGSDPRWELIPNDPRESGFFLEMIYSSSEPGDLVRYVTIDSQNANITAYLKDHRGETLRRVVAHARQFIDEHPVKGARLRLAGGYGGLLAAINEEVARHQATVTVLAFGIILLLCSLAYRSLVAGLLFLLPLLVSNYLTYALMGARHIGLDVNALPVVALGVGLGVDYGLYIVERIREEFARSGDVAGSIRVALTTAGKAVLFTASTMVFGVIFWAFSFLRFQADMGLLLAFWMVMSMLGGLVLLPTVISLVKPRFIFGR
ncbi:MAG: RND transporter [Deltaproteobacteria bacterium]|nr:MAG: RND transporter [Deltaproteobacteria bacterium]